MVRDAALSHVLCRDNVIDLGYFDSITRANARLRGLVGCGLLKRLDVPFFRQNLYSAGPKAVEVAGPNIGSLLRGRSDSPRYLQHALAVTAIRIALMKKGAEGWRFEQQLWTAFEDGGRRWEVRPDGLAVLSGGRLLAVEADLGHVDRARFRAKLEAYARFASRGGPTERWGAREFRLLTVTAGPARRAALAALAPDSCPFHHDCRTFDDLGIPTPGSWS